MIDLFTFFIVLIFIEFLVLSAISMVEWSHRRSIFNEALETHGDAYYKRGGAVSVETVQYSGGFVNAGPAVDVLFPQQAEQ